MAEFTVAHSYAARRDGRQLGPWKAGDVVDLDGDDAAWVNRDSPGCLESADDTPAAEPDRQKPASRDRQHRGGQNRGR